MCGNWFDLPDAQVVCRQLYNLTSDAVAYPYAYFGKGTGPIFATTGRCVGSETHLVNCTSIDVDGGPDCEHNQDAGVKCLTVNLTGIYMYYVCQLYHLKIYLKVVHMEICVW